MSDTETTDLATVQEWLELMPDAVDTSPASADAIALDIAKRILTAPDADSVLDQQELLEAKDRLGVPLTIRDVRWNGSSFAGGPGVYAVMDAVNHRTGEVELIACGGRNVMAQLYRLVQLRALPRDLMIVEAKKPTANGYTPLWLSKVPS